MRNKFFDGYFVIMAITAIAIIVTVGLIIWDKGNTVYFEKSYEVVNTPKYKLVPASSLDRKRELYTIWYKTSNNKVKSKIIDCKSTKINLTNGKNRIIFEMRKSPLHSDNKFTGKCTLYLTEETISSMK